MLYLVATPIGNLEDVTLRALRILEACDLIACEDTRVTQKLLTLLNLPPKKCITYQDHNADEVRPKLITLLHQGQNIALVSDAGMPLISDPGYKLVHEVNCLGLPVTSLPGANALLTALQLSGLPTDKFFFGGFLPVKKTERQKALADVGNLEATLIFYESPKRLLKTLEDIEEILGARTLSIARELTKKFEEIRSGTPKDLLTYYQENPIKGEVVLVIDRGKQTERPTPEQVKQLLKKELKKLSVRSASEKISILTGYSKKEVYTWALDMNAEK